MLWKSVHHRTACVCSVSSGIGLGTAQQLQHTLWQNNYKMHKICQINEKIWRSGNNSTSMFVKCLESYQFFMFESSPTRFFWVTSPFGPLNISLAIWWVFTGPKRAYNSKKVTKLPKNYHFPAIAIVLRVASSWEMLLLCGEILLCRVPSLSRFESTNCWRVLEASSQSLRFSDAIHSVRL